MRILDTARRDTRRTPTASSLPEGVRAYAVGDIHGRLDLLDRMLDMIDADDAARSPAETHLVFLSDYIDRGPQSAGVIDRLIRLQQARARVHCLMGNHEEVFLAVLRDPRAGELFARIGGRRTLASYGVPAILCEAPEPVPWAELIIRHVPPAHLDWMEALEPYHRLGDYLFVHAGIRPGIPLEGQSPSDLRWIREEFLAHEGDHGMTVVHGHTITAEADCRRNRIGIDTGAYFTDRLTAVALDGRDRRILQTRG